MYVLSNTDATSKPNENKEINCKISLFFSFFKIKVCNAASPFNSLKTPNQLTASRQNIY